MKRWLKVLIIVLSVLIVLFVGILVAVSPVAKSVIEKHSKSWLNRQIKIDHLGINLLSGKVRADGIVMYEANDSTPFASIDTLFLDVKIYKLLSSEVYLEEGRIVAPYVSIWQKGDEFNFSSMFPKDSTQVEEPKDTTKSGMSWVIDLNKVAIIDGNARYSDLLLDNTIDLKHISLMVPSLVLGKGVTDAGLNLQLEQGTIASSLHLNQENNEYLLKLKLDDIGIEIAKPYLAQILHLGDFSGALYSDLALSGSLDHIIEFTANGNLALRNLHITNSNGGPVVSCDLLAASIERLNLNEKLLKLESVKVDGVKSAFINRGESSNFSDLLGSSEKEEGEPKEETKEETAKEGDDAFQIISDKVMITRVDFTYEDYTLPTPFIYPVRNIEVSCNNFTLSGTNNVTGNLQLPEAGNVKFKWSGNIESLSNMNLYVDLKNVSTVPFSPYCEYYTAYPITHGTLSFENDTRIVNNQLNSKNSIDIYDLTVAAKLKDEKPKVNIPLRTGLYILTDRKGNIQFNIPVKGNIKDPEFKFGKIIWQTISNLIVKVALSPGNFIANSLGLGNNITNKIAIDPMALSFSSSQYTAMNEIKQIYDAKPDLMVEMVQYANREYMMAQMALLNAKLGYYHQVNQDSIITLNEYGMDLIKSISNGNAGFNDYVNRLLAERSMSSEGSITDRCERLSSNEILSSQVDTLMSFRNNKLYTHLTENLKIEPSHVKISNATDSLPKGNSAYYRIIYTISESALDSISE